MAETVFFVGNGINTINNNQSWEALLRRLYNDYYDSSVPFSEIKQKPFPLVYEQIVLWQLKQYKRITIEPELKKIIAEETNSIVPNSIHRLIAAAKVNHVITANYEFSLETGKPARFLNNGCVKETTYSIFRHFAHDGKTYWHLHGDALHTGSINLGYEHYCGQLQKMREYTTGTYVTTNNKLTRLFTKPLVNRAYLQAKQVYSWIDLFFKNNTTIKIFGLRLELEELDIWWLLTYRAKILYGAKQGHLRPRNNKLQYFIPAEFTKEKDAGLLPGYRTKKQLLLGMNVEVIEIDLPHGEAFYKAVLKY